MLDSDLHSLVQQIDSADIYDLVSHTSLDLAPILSKRLGHSIYLKREDLQPVFSFKIRGAYHKLSQLTPDQTVNGVIASSAGNHAQGVAISAAKLGIKATIVMPMTTPPIKVKSVQRYGAKTILFGDAYDDAFGHALEIAKAKSLTFIPPFDDWDVIAGQGTVAKELLDQLDTMDAVFIPVGGGGLIAGIAAYLKTKKPSIRIIAVEPEDSPTLYTSFHANKRVELATVGIFVDGVAVKLIGEKPFEICRHLVDECLLVKTDEVCAAIKDIFEETRSIVEPAGALAIAGIKKYAASSPLKNQRWVAINSGANINFDRLRNIAERADYGEYTEAVFGVEIPEAAGSFKQFCQDIGKRSITEFNYRFSSSDKAFIYVGIQLQDGQTEHEWFLNHFKSIGYSITDFTNNEMAKLHIRHMVGGKKATPVNEVVYRVQFPERPGALLSFLNKISPQWNISLFHYRNQGSAYGRVLVGIQSSHTGADPEFESKLNDLNYTFFNETDNPAFGMFL